VSTFDFGAGLLVLAAVVGVVNDRTLAPTALGGRCAEDAQAAPETKLTVQARSPCELCALNTLASRSEHGTSRPTTCDPIDGEVARVEAPSRNEGRSGLTFARKLIEAWANQGARKCKSHHLPGEVAGASLKPLLK
jgi:hypothetical protein